jgi:hypothetical protein
MQAQPVRHNMQAQPVQAHTLADTYTSLADTSALHIAQPVGVDMRAVAHTPAQLVAAVPAVAPVLAADNPTAGTLTAGDTVPGSPLGEAPAAVHRSRP